MSDFKGKPYKSKVSKENSNWDSGKICQSGIFVRHQIQVLSIISGQTTIKILTIKLYTSKLFFQSYYIIKELHKVTSTKKEENLFTESFYKIIWAS